MLALAREEGPGNGELNDLFRIDIPFAPTIFFVIKVSSNYAVKKKQSE